MGNRRISFLIFILMAVATTVKGQPHHNFTMSLQEVIETAHSQSPSAILARHNFIVNYWQFRTYKAPGMGCYTYRNEVCIFTIAKTGEKCIFDNQKNENIEEDSITD